MMLWAPSPVPVEPLMSGAPAASPSPRLDPASLTPSAVGGAAPGIRSGMSWSRRRSPRRGPGRGHAAARSAATGVLVVSTAAVMSLLGCSEGEDPQGSPRPSASSPDAGGVVPSSSADPVIAGTADEGARAVGIGVSVVVALVDRAPSTDEAWWAGVAVWLSPGAREAMVGIDRAGVPATSVTGPGVWVPGEVENAGQVRVPTDAGTYVVALSRVTPSDSWWVDRVRPPEGTR